MLEFLTNRSSSISKWCSDNLEFTTGGLSCMCHQRPMVTRPELTVQSSWFLLQWWRMLADEWNLQHTAVCTNWHSSWDGRSSVWTSLRTQSMQDRSVADQLVIELVNNWWPMPFKRQHLTVASPNPLQLFSCPDGNQCGCYRSSSSKW